MHWPRTPYINVGFDLLRQVCKIRLFFRTREDPDEGPNIEIGGAGSRRAVEASFARRAFFFASTGTRKEDFEYIRIASASWQAQRSNRNAGEPQRYF